ncbi:MAG: pectin acetylesterase-family hydrolase [Rubrivivax sp.]|nr:pectin acetylesterase-family hydrolase [Rubrivivax sp.]
MKRIHGLWLTGLAAWCLGMPAANAADAGWKKIENLSPAIGADGKLHQATCSSYPGTDPRFSFWAKRGTSKNLVVFFEGGGACWDSLTCTFPTVAGLPAQVPQLFMPAVPANNNPANYDGIFRTDNPANPVKDWSIVYIPYCTGDLHAGSSTKTYANVGHPVFPLPSTFEIQHKGFDNFMVVLDWVKKHIDAPKSVLVAGSSAGGYGASVNFPWVAKTYPNAHMYVIADGSQGVMTPTWDASTPGRGSWNLQLAPWVFGSSPSKIRGADLLRVAAQAYPHAKVSQFTTAMDSVQIGFYGLMKTYYPPGGACPNPAVDWYQQMTSTLQSYDAAVPNYRYYMAGGTYHTTLRSPTFYTEASAGTVYSDWVAGMLANRGGTNDHGGWWEDAACPTCIMPLACP